MSRCAALAAVGCTVTLMACAGEPDGVRASASAAGAAPADSPATAALPRGPVGVTSSAALEDVRRVFFGWDDATLTTEAKTALTRVATARGGADLLVVGHTDTSGPRPYNQLLSERRAEAVRDFLITVGVPAHQIQLEARGQRQPLVRTDDNVRSPLNRRVRIEIADS